MLLGCNAAGVLLDVSGLIISHTLTFFFCFGSFACCVAVTEPRKQPFFLLPSQVGRDGDASSPDRHE
jgi:hypothetical protein